MTQDNILVVDADEKSRRVLEISLKKAGHTVESCASARDALDWMDDHTPALIISDTNLPGISGFDFCARVKENLDWEPIPFVFLTDTRSSDAKKKGLELGVEEYLTKPIYVKEITTRVELLLQRRHKDQLAMAGAEEARGDLADVTFIDLLQTLEEGQRSGTAEFAREGRRGILHFRDGEVIDAAVGKLRGGPAVHRLMQWPGGQFVVKYLSEVRRRDRINQPIPELLLDGMRELDAYEALLEGAPELDRIFEVNYRNLAEQIRSLPDEVNSLIRLFDGFRTTEDILEDSSLGPVSTLRALKKLIAQELVYDVTPQRRAEDAEDGEDGRESGAELGSWLEDEEEVEDEASRGEPRTEAEKVRRRREERKRRKGQSRRRRAQQSEGDRQVWADEAQRRKAQEPRVQLPALASASAEAAAPAPSAEQLELQRQLEALENQAEQLRLEKERLEQERLEHLEARRRAEEQERQEAEQLAEEEARLQQQQETAQLRKRLEEAQAVTSQLRNERLDLANEVDRQRAEAERIVEQARAEAEQTRAEVEHEREARLRALDAELEAQKQAEALAVANMKAELERRRQELEAREQELALARERQKAEEAARIAAQRAEVERLERERAEAELLAAEQAQQRADAEAARRAAEEAEAARLMREEAARQEAERAEAARVARLEAERAEAERQQVLEEQRRRAEAERIAAEQIEAERRKAQEADEALREEQRKADGERIRREEEDAKKAAISALAEAARRAKVERDRAAKEQADEERRLADLAAAAAIAKAEAEEARRAAELAEDQRGLDSSEDDKAEAASGAVPALPSAAKPRTSDKEVHIDERRTQENLRLTPVPTPSKTEAAEESAPAESSPDTPRPSRQPKSTTAERILNPSVESEHPEDAFFSAGETTEQFYDYAEPASGGGNKTPYIVLGVVVVALILGGGYWIAQGGGGDAPATTTSKEGNPTARDRGKIATPGEDNEGNGKWIGDKGKGLTDQELASRAEGLGTHAFETSRSIADVYALTHGTDEELDGSTNGDSNNGTDGATDGVDEEGATNNGEEGAVAEASDAATNGEQPPGDEAPPAAERPADKAAVADKKAANPPAPAVANANKDKKPDNAANVARKETPPPVDNTPDPAVGAMDDKARKRALQGHIQRGRRLVGAGNYNGAIAELTKGAEISPGSYQVNFWLGKAHYESGNTAAARRYFERAMRANPNGDALMYLGQVYMASGQQAKGLDAYKKYVKLHPNGRHTPAIRNILARYQ